MLVTSSKLWTPNRLSNCVLWLDANDTSTITTVNDAVSSWRSKVGNLEAIQNTAANRPTLTTYDSKRNAIVFDGVNDFLQIVSTAFPTTFFTTNFTIAVSVIFTRLVTGNNAQSVLTKRTTSTNGIVFANVGNTNNFVIDWGGSTNRISTINPILNANTTYLISRSNSERELFRNGLKSTHSAGSANPNTTSNLFIGCTETQISFIRGAINEIIMYQSFLLDADLQKLAGYLHWKWLNPEVLPVNNTYRTTIPKTFN